MSTPREQSAGGSPPLTRRSFLAISAAVALAACADEREAETPAPASSQPTASATPGTDRPSPSPTAPSASGPPPGRTLYRGAALADARSDELQLGISVLVEDGLIRWIRPADDEGEAGPADGLEVVDAAGATIVPGMVDAHSHVTLPGGANWIDRISDAPAALLRVAERNGPLMTAAGIRWARDVGSPYVEDPVDGRARGLALGVRDRWRSRSGYPYLRAAGTWLDAAGPPLAVPSLEARGADELLANALRQLDDGADLVKLYLQGPEPGRSPWSTAEIRAVVDAVHGRGARVTAHVVALGPAGTAVEAGVDALEHGFELDRELAAEMARRGTFLVTTLTVFRSRLTFARTTTDARFASAEARRRIEARLEQASASAALAHAAAVPIAAGTDFGGGSGRANQLAWEVESLVAAGLEPWQALAAATWRGGELLGEPDAGVVREGGPADFFLVHGDPLSDPASLWRVWRVAWAG